MVLHVSWRVLERALMQGLSGFRAPGFQCLGFELKVSALGAQRDYVRDL